MSRLLRLVARATLSAIFISSGVDLIQNPVGRTKRAADALPGLPELPMIGRVHGATMLAAGTTMAIGILPSLSAGVLAASLIPNTYVGHPFWKEEDPGARRGQQIQFLKNVSLFGGLIALILEEHERGTR
jgi:putative oxidoreductase